jgi:ABC-type nitrate/sulfonate/bicarbonate transport system substrate-binding protein
MGYASFKAFLATLLLLLATTAQAEALKKIRIASKGAGETLLPYHISQRLGFYREEGLEVEAIVARGTVTTQVLVGGAVDYGNGGSIPAMLGGARLKILLISTDKPAQYIVSAPKISEIKQLAGKTIAVSDSGGNSTLILRELLAKNGLALDAVRMRALGDQSLRLGALLGGVVDATLLSYGAAQQAETKGFRILAYTGDHVSTLAANLETTDEKIRSAPNEVYSAVKGTLKGQIFFHRNPDEAIKFVMEELRLSDVNAAREFWSERTKQASDLAKIGRASDESLLSNIDRVRQQMKMVGAAGRIKENLTVDQVYDLSFVKKAYEDLRAKNWDPLRYVYVKK